MQDSVAIMHIRRDRNLFLFNLGALGKVIQVNTQAMIITKWGKPAHPVSCINKVHI